MIYTFTLNPAVDKTAVLPGFTPGAVNRIASCRVDAGGKGINVSKNLQVLGLSSVAAGFVGGSTGAVITDMLEQQGIRASFIQTGVSTRTNLKILDPDRGITTDINEPGAAVPPALLQKICSFVRTAVKQGDVCVLAGSLPDGIPQDAYRTLTELCHEMGAYVVLDADGEALRRGLAAGPDLIKPNEEELSRLLGRPLAGRGEVLEAARQIRREGVGAVCVTMGGAGIIWCGKNCLRARGLSVPVASTVGAGDATVAALVYGRCTGMTEEETLRLAIAAGAANVTTEGTVPADLPLIKQLEKQVVIEE